MTQLTLTLYAVEVPSDAKCKVNNKEPIFLEFTSELENERYAGEDQLCFEKIGFNFKILGEVTKDEISFDIEIPNHGMLNNKYAFRNLLQSKGICFENPYQQDWNELCTFGHGDFSKDGKSSYELYFESENKVIKGKLIILEKL